MKISDGIKVLLISVEKVWQKYGKWLLKMCWNPDYTKDSFLNMAVRKGGSAGIKFFRSYQVFALQAGIMRNEQPDIKNSCQS